MVLFELETDLFNEEWKFSQIFQGFSEKNPRLSVVVADGLWIVQLNVFSWFLNFNVTGLNSEFSFELSFQKKKQIRKN